MLGILEGEQNNFRVKVLLAIDTYTLALHSETPLVIRSCIIPHSYDLSLRVSCGRETRRHTCLLQSNPTRLLCCQKQPYHPPSCSVFSHIYLHAQSNPQKWGKMMNKTEQEALRKILVALFLEHPRGGTNQALQKNQGEIGTKTSLSSQPTRSQQLGDKKHGR